MLEPITDLPEGVVGFEAVGEIGSEDYRDTLIPAIENHEGPVRLVYVLGERFTGYSGGAAWQDAKLGLDHHAKWSRAAIVSDLDWVRHLATMFGWMVPGHFALFPLADRDAAIAWAAGDEVTSTTEHTSTTPGTTQGPYPTLMRYQMLTPTAPLSPGAGMRVMPAPMPHVAATWAADPSGRHQWRWWDGTRWTDDVADGGVAGHDPLP